MRVEGSNPKTGVDAEDPTFTSAGESGSDLLPDPAVCIGLRMGDVGATVAALILRGDRASRNSARQERELAEQRELGDNARQLSELRQRADEILVTGVVTGLVKSGSGVLAAAAGDQEINAERLGKSTPDGQTALSDKVGLELDSKLTSAYGDSIKAFGESSEAQKDVGAREAERDAKLEQKRMDDAKDSEQALKKLSSDVVEFLREFERTMATAQSAIWNRA
jgi:hypothetical protein